MNLVKTEITHLIRNKEAAGILQFKGEYKVTEAKGELTYAGPKIPPGEWNKILSFLKWVYDTTQSEAQVRLYLNTKTNVWAAWAYPQEANTGMTAKEIANEAANAQRAQFKDDAGWIYFGTVHSHCACSAFQSSTDESNEKDQDGIHITIGYLDKTVYDFHARLYFGKDQFTPDMSVFWETGDVMSGVPDVVRDMIPDGWQDKLARMQMVVPPSEPSFPEPWKENVVDVRPQWQKNDRAWDEDNRQGWNGRSNIIHIDGKPKRWDESTHRYIEQEWDQFKSQYVPLGSASNKVPEPSSNPAWSKQRRKKGNRDKLMPIDVRKQEACDELFKMANELGAEEADIMLESQGLADCPLACALVKVLKDYDLVPSDMVDQIEWEFKFDKNTGALKDPVLEYDKSTNQSEFESGFPN
jgi:hypothetical protein